MFETGKSGPRQIEVRVLEIAIGLDRCVYNWSVADARETAVA